MGEVKLLPCPFCGGKKIDGMFIRDGWRVGCMECGGGVQAYHPEAHKRAAEKWNRREGSASPDMLKALKEAHRALLYYEWYSNPKSGWSLPENTTLRGEIEASLAKAEGRTESIPLSTEGEEGR